MSRKNIKASRRQQLIDANMACIARYGLADTTIAHVSKAADMSRGICNFYFESKEKMMLETLRFLADEYRQALEQAAAEKDALAAVVNVHFSQKLCQSRRLAVWMAFVAHAASHAPYRKILAESARQATDAIAGCPGATGAPDTYALIQGAWLHFLLAPEPATREALATRCLAFARSGRASGPKTASAARPARPVRKKAEEMPLLDFGDLFAKKA